jgi:hypothetical protein
MITAKIVADSIARNNRRITTFVLEYPRFIHAEFMTHRTFSRNASSSRAIPVEKQLQRVMQDPAMPIFWGKNQKGMQAAEELSDVPTDSALIAPGYESPRAEARKLWLEARDHAVHFTRMMMDLGLHKQLANRITEPWQHIGVVATSADAGLGNFFNLRHHKMAQPEIQVLAQEMWEAYERNVPTVRAPGDWHLPFVRAEERLALDVETLKKISAARCARVSYFTHEGRVPNLDEDLDLFQRLMGGFPKHASPTEHQATPAEDYIGPLNGNLGPGWIQFRKTIPGEFLPEFKGPTES